MPSLSLQLQSLCTSEVCGSHLFSHDQYYSLSFFASNQLDHLNLRGHCLLPLRNGATTPRDSPARPISILPSDPPIVDTIFDQSGGPSGTREWLVGVDWRSRRERWECMRRMVNQQDSILQDFEVFKLLKCFSTIPAR